MRKFVIRFVLLFSGLFISAEALFPAVQKDHDRPEVTRYNDERETSENVAFSFDAGDSYRTPHGQRLLKRIAGLSRSHHKP